MKGWLGWCGVVVYVWRVDMLGLGQRGICVWLFFSVGVQQDCTMVLMRRIGFCVCVLVG